MTPLPLQTEFLFRMVLSVGAPQMAGTARNGELRIIPVTGGTAEGPRFKGEVLPGTAGDWLRVVEAREGVEIAMARAAARHATQDAAGQFAEAAHAMQRAVVSGNVIAFMEADKSLDEAMALAADNPFAARLAAPLQTHSRRFWYRYKADTGLAVAAEHHLGIIRAVLDGDGEAAARQAARLMELLRNHAEAAARR